MIFISKHLTLAVVLLAIFFCFFGVGYAMAPEDDLIEPAEETEVTTVSTQVETKAEEVTTTESDFSDLVVDISTTETRMEVTTPAKRASKSVVATTAARAKIETEATEATTIEETTKVEKSTTTPVKKSTGSVQISDNEYYYICCLVFGEAGAEPYDGQVLVAQCFYNAMAESGGNAYTTAKGYGYTGSTKKGTNESVKKAVAAVFYDGYRYTDEPVLFFYSPRYMKNHWSSWHESQTFVCELGGHRFFKRNGA